MTDMVVIQVGGGPAAGIYMMISAAMIRCLAESRNIDLRSQRNSW